MYFQLYEMCTILAYIHFTDENRDCFTKGLEYFEHTEDSF